MCGRYVLNATLKNLEEKYGAVPEGTYSLKPNYNVAPSLDMPIIREKDEQPVIQKFRWGLVPFWADSIQTKYTMINARAETLDQKRSYAGPFKSKRCVVPASGFYEWKTTAGGEKIPHYITLKSSPIMNMAGLYEKWEPKEEQGDPVYSFTIITTDANKPMADLHDRMPAFLLDEEVSLWLDADNQQVAGLKELLRPWPDDDIDYYRVGKQVNNARTNGEELISPYRDLFS